VLTIAYTQRDERRTSPVGGEPKVCEGPLPLPPRHHLEYYPDILVLQRNDGSVVATFSAVGANPYEIRKTAEQDKPRPEPEETKGAIPKVDLDGP